MTLLGPKGQPITSADFKKASPPKTGSAFGPWAGRDITYATLPGGGIVQFDLSKLTLSDFRSMRDHYQVNASLAVLSFMQHQSDWHIECDNAKLRDLATEQMERLWTPLNRSMATANWAGYSPNALEWDSVDRNVIISKVKDLIPEECAVNWKDEEGWAPANHIKPKFKTYDGIKMIGQQWPIPVENSFWYPLLMENGNYYGQKLLRPAFQSWFFSILVHLFANRYYERFGEPVPVGRAPFDEDVTLDGETVSGNEYMLNVLKQFRNHSVVVLPSDKTQGMNGTSDFDYQIEYLESQMRGADFERYLTRLDEEISIGLFTPILLMRTADVGSYNLGVGHMQMYLWMLNAMNADRKYYIDKYLLSPLADYNVGLNAPRPKIVFRKLGNTSGEMVKDILLALINKDMAKPDLQQIGQIAGLTIEEVHALTDPNPTPDPNAPDPNAPTPDPANNDQAAVTASRGSDPRDVAREIIERVRPQVERAFSSSDFGADWTPDFGFTRKMATALQQSGVYGYNEANAQLYRRLEHWTREMFAMGRDEHYGPDDFMSMFSNLIFAEVDRALDAASS